jgi:prepilin-type N-terminal cleavage/methylation domain-containing protein
MHKRAWGFTLIELVIVIAVIGVLTAVTVVAYNGVKTRAQIVSVSDGLTKVGQSMRAWAIDNKFSSWPTEPITVVGTSLVSMIQSDPTLQKNLQNVPSVVGVQTEDWFYDNEGDEKTDCTSSYNGVNIVIRFVTNAAVAQGVDNAIDDGNLSCGTVRYVDQRIFYTLSNTQAITN